MTKKNVAEVLVDVLTEAGVERIYGVAADSPNGITDTIRTAATIVHVTAAIATLPEQQPVDLRAQNFQ